jgi:hypothetical protein
MRIAEPAEHELLDEEIVGDLIQQLPNKLLDEEIVGCWMKKFVG